MFLEEREREAGREEGNENGEEKRKEEGGDARVGMSNGVLFFLAS